MNKNRLDNLHYLKTVFEALIETGEGSSIPQLTVPGIRPKLIPIPPIIEQCRIQSKLDEILKFISGISFEKEELRRIVQQTKSKILDLAIRGKLVPQDPNDEPASAAFLPEFFQAEQMLVHRLNLEEQVFLLLPNPIFSDVVLLYPYFTNSFQHFYSIMF